MIRATGRAPAAKLAATVRPGWPSRSTPRSAAPSTCWSASWSTADAGGADGPLAAYPMGKGSGSVTTFSRADGFVTIGRHEEIVEAGTHGRRAAAWAASSRLADLVVIGSHCVGLDFLLGQLHDRGFRTKFLAVGSTGRPGGGPARRVRPGGHAPAGPRDRPVQPAVSDPRAGADRRLRPAAGRRVPPRRPAVRGPRDARRSRCGRAGRSASA